MRPRCHDRCGGGVAGCEQHVLCCVVCWCQHGTCCSHPATPPPHLSWHRGLTAPPPLSPLCDCTHRSSSRGQTAGHTSTRDDDDTGRCVPMCAPHEVLMHGGHPGHTHAAIWQRGRGREEVGVSIRCVQITRCKWRAWSARCAATIPNHTPSLSQLHADGMLSGREGEEGGGEEREGQLTHSLSLHCTSSWHTPPFISSPSLSSPFSSLSHTHHTHTHTITST